MWLTTHICNLFSRLTVKEFWAVPFDKMTDTTELEPFQATVTLDLLAEKTWAQLEADVTDSWRERHEAYLQGQISSLEGALSSFKEELDTLQRARDSGASSEALRPVDLPSSAKRAKTTKALPHL